MSDPVIDQVVTELSPAAQLYVGCTIQAISPEVQDLTETRFEDCRFVASSLRNARLTQTRFDDCRFVDCDLMGTDWTQVDWPAFVMGDPPMFIGCRLDYANFHGVKLLHGVFYGCSMIETDLRQTILRGADLRHADLTRAELTAADLRNADLSGAEGYLLDPRETRVTGAILSMPGAAGVLEALGLQLAAPPARMDSGQRAEQPTLRDRPYG
ncbi:MAG: pentapeptide repeat-containing protein [Euzebya sp.]